MGLLLAAIFLAPLKAKAPDQSFFRVESASSVVTKKFRDNGGSAIEGQRKAGSRVEAWRGFPRLLNAANPSMPYHPQGQGAFEPWAAFASRVKAPQAFIPRRRLAQDQNRLCYCHGISLSRHYSRPIGIGVAPAGELFAGRLIYYDENGDEALLRAFGVNYYDAFTRYVVDSNDTSFVEGFQFLSSNNVPVARVIAAPFFPAQWGLYFKDKDEYYRRLDMFLASAEQYGIGLVMDLFWTAKTILGEVVDDAVDAGVLTPGMDFVPNDPLNTDIYGQPTYAEYSTDLGRMNSGTIAFIRHYTREIVERYVHSPAVWGWEFCNEMNNKVDHPNLAAARRRPVGPGTGVFLPSTSANLVELPPWTGPDDLTRKHARVAKSVFAVTVRSIDAWRFIMSGDAVPRKEAWHNWTMHTWKNDNRSEHSQVLPVDNPEPMDTVTIHLYAGKPGGKQTVWFPDDGPITNVWLTGQYREHLEYYMAESKALGRPLIVGEWGACSGGKDKDEQKTFHRFLQALIDSGVQLSMLWDFDTRNRGRPHWWIHTGQIEGWPATLMLYQIVNDNPDLWDLRQANETFGAWPQEY